MYKIVLIRHGESEWNKSGRFTGWTDIDLTVKGVRQAKGAAKILKKEGFSFDLCYSSLLRRAIKTSHLILDELDLLWIPLKKDWRLNERHYGDLQGKNKKEAVKEFGEEQVLAWRRSYKTRPPKIMESNIYNQFKDSRYKSLKRAIKGESLEDVVHRVIPFWEKVIIPDLKKGHQIMIAASGNSLRALLKYLENISEKKIVDLNIPYCVPIVCEFNKNFKLKKRYYLGDEHQIAKIIDEVKGQIKLK